MSQSLEGKVVWITGSSRGIGRVVASHLSSLGATVAIHGTTPTSSRAFDEADSLQAVAEQIYSNTHNSVVAVHGDLTDPKVVEECVQRIKSECGSVDILVNNAGGDIGARGVTGERAGKPAINDAIEISLDDIQTVINRNLMTCILACREVIPEMVRKKRGHVVNIGSIAGLAGSRQGVMYAVSKSAVHEYTRCLAAQVRQDNVNVNAIAPGEIITARFEASRPTNSERKIKDGDLTRYGWPIEVARTVEFLVTNNSSYITGQILRVDGGAQLFPA